MNCHWSENIGKSWMRWRDNTSNNNNNISYKTHPTNKIAIRKKKEKQRKENKILNSWIYVFLLYFHHFSFAIGILFCFFNIIIIIVLCTYIWPICIKHKWILCHTCYPYDELTFLTIFLAAKMVFHFYYFTVFCFEPYQQHTPSTFFTAVNLMQSWMSFSFHLFSFLHFF